MVYGQDRVGNKIHLFHSIASVDCVVDGLGLLHFPKHRGQPFDTVGHQHKLIFSQWTAEQKPIRLMDGQRLGMKRESGGGRWAWTLECVCMHKYQSSHSEPAGNRRKV